VQNCNREADKMHKNGICLFCVFRGCFCRRESMRIRIAAVLLAVFCASISIASAEDITVISPDGRVQFRLLSGDKSRLQYAVAFREKPVIEVSELGMIVDGINLAAGVQIGKIERYQVKETYPWYGAHSMATDHCNGMKIAITHVQSRSAYALDIRAYNDGVAFRQMVPGEGKRIPDEATAFRLPAGSTVWYHDTEGHYEGVHVRKGIASVPAGAWAAPPVTLRLADNAGYASITEGALVQYSGMALLADGAGGFSARLGHSVPASWPFRLRFKQDVERMTQPAPIMGTITTPWRIVMIGPDLNTLVNCDIVHNVAPAPDPKLFPDGLKTGWVKPGRAVWSYLDGGNRTFEGMKEFSKLAGELGFEYNLLEGFWSKWPESQLKELVDYSRERGVKIIVWKSRSDLGDPQRLREFFEMCGRTGVAGAKIDFFDHENKEVVDLYEMILRAAAQHRLIIDFHGSNKPTGQERTWPNELGLEGIRGLEGQPPWARHDVTLPFTRMLAGLADYTPTHFSRKLGDTTWAHQVANAVILTAPLLVYAAHPANILANPAADMVKSIPSVWDETIVLPVSDIGEIAAIARRKGDTWFLAITNGPNARNLSVDLSFLGAGSYTSMLLRDTGEAAAVKKEHLVLSRTDALYVDLRSGGGFVARFAK
jgi:alpha-glucosidase